MPAIECCFCIDHPLSNSSQLRVVAIHGFHVLKDRQQIFVIVSQYVRGPTTLKAGGIRTKTKPKPPRTAQPKGQYSLIGTGLIGSE